MLLVTTGASLSQDLIPRAYLITPIGSNAVIVANSWNSGEIVFEPSVPIEDATGDFQVSILSYYHSYSLFGRSSNIVLSVPYANGKFAGTVDGDRTQVRRSGLADARIRFSVNLKGGRALHLGEFVRWREKGLMGASLTVVVPVGQNDPARVVNPGTNRWAFKPEIGFTRRWGRWLAEGYGGVWLFTSNPTFFPGNAKRSQKPMGAFEFHAGRYLKPGLWASLDTNFWTGGRSTLNGVQKQDAQRESRIGATVSVPIVRHQSFKLSYSRGAITRIGGNFRTIAIAWQYSWIGKPR